MVNIIHHGENAERLNSIIEAAQKRFGIYGMDKTTMKEIASDLGMSKGSLYYYYPDKEDLYIAVVEKEQEMFMNTLNHELQFIDNPDELLRAYVRLRLKYFRSFLNLSRFSPEDLIGIKTKMRDLMIGLQLKQVDIVQNIFTKGVENGVYFIENTCETAQLFLDLFKSMGASQLRKKNTFYLEQEEYDLLVIKVNKFTEIFINGLKYNSKIVNNKS